MKNILEIEGLEKSFKEVKAVDGISFSVKEGQLFSFLGLNGAGKSTTINIICSSLQKDKGNVIIDGYDIDKDMDKIKSILGVVFQNSLLDGNLTVRDNLFYRGKMYGIESEALKTRINELAEQLEFKDILSRQVGKLSGGQRRRVDIARALIHKPKLLILDEPTTGLDPKTRLLVWELLNKLRKQSNLTIFLTTHYMEEAGESDYIVILDGGKIVAQDTPNNLKNKFGHDFIKVYKYKDELIEKLNGYNYKKEKEVLTIELKQIGEALDFIAKFKEYIEDFEVIKGKMDGVFLTVTGKTIGEI